MRQHAMSKLHKMSLGDAELLSSSTRPVVLPKPLASVNNIDFVNITYENRDISPILALGVLRWQFWGASIQRQLSGYTTRTDKLMIVHS